MLGGAPDVAAVCLDCGTIFLLPCDPAPPEPVGVCAGCGGFVVSPGATTGRLTELVLGIRRSGSLHYATLLSLVESWKAAQPDPLAVLAELSEVAPEILAVFELDECGAGMRLALGRLLGVTLPAMVTDAGVVRYDAEVAARGVIESLVSTASPRPTT